jgi:hypothetical protein
LSLRQWLRPHYVTATARGRPWAAGIFTSRESGITPMDGYVYQDGRQVLHGETDEEEPVERG